ncbi:MAG: hypothetical protein EPN33_09895 [Acidobacteria bacterium]|nr:MAG: hypothetical protein EPN33_09895 [Acidobacteriota bacterium]
MPLDGGWFSAQLEQAVVAALVTDDRRQHPPLRALVLAGSMARRESGWLLGTGGAILLGDAELLCVLQDGDRWPQPAQRMAWHERLQARLRREGLQASVSLTPVRARYLRRLPPHLFGYELRTTGRVLWGDPHVLDETPQFQISDLPREDAWRLLANRLMELVPSAVAAAPPQTPQQVYPWVKLYLDMATSYLLFAGAYAPSYRARSQQMRVQFDAQGGDPLGCITSALVAQVEACTAWKLNPHAGITTLFRSGFRAHALAAARQLWLWELQQLTGSPAADASVLWRRWLHQHSLAGRLRGWASAVRHDGLPSPRYWPRWLLLAAHASPRHCVYEAAWALLWRDQRDLPPCAAARLPLPQPPGTAGMASAVLANYQRLVAQTRA